MGATGREAEFDRGGGSECEAGRAAGGPRGREVRGSLDQILGLVRDARTPPSWSEFHRKLQPDIRPNRRFESQSLTDQVSACGCRWLPPGTRFVPNTNLAQPVLPHPLPPTRQRKSTQDPVWFRYRSGPESFALAKAPATIVLGIHLM